MYVCDKDAHLIESYHKYLIEDGPMPDFASYDGENSEAFYAILRYVTSYYLRWSPQELYDNLTFKIAQRFKLNPLISALNLRPEGAIGYTWLVRKAYPKVDFDIVFSTPERDFKMNIIERIQGLRDEMRLIDRDVERGAGIANSSIAQWKRGVCKPSLVSIIRLSKFFDVSSDYLLGLSDLRERAEQAASLSEDEKQLLALYRDFDTLDRSRLIHYCMDIADEANVRPK